MELRIPSVEQLRTIYDRDLKEAFPTAELKPLRNIEKSWAEGWYRPYCLFDGDNIVGEAFLWLGHPGWALLDYLCVSSSPPQRRRSVHPSWRSCGSGSADTVIFGESEAPEDAPDPAMAGRRLGFYARNGLRTAGYDTEMFGVHYKTLYLAGGPGGRRRPDGGAPVRLREYLFCGQVSTSMSASPLIPRRRRGQRCPGSSKAENADLLEKEALL